jgi:hypothetical protein
VASLFPPKYQCPHRPSLLIILPAHIKALLRDNVGSFGGAVSGGRAFVVHDIELVVVVEFGLADHLEVSADAARRAERLAGRLLTADRRHRGGDGGKTWVGEGLVDRLEALRRGGRVSRWGWG